MEPFNWFFYFAYFHPYPFLLGTNKNRNRLCLKIIGIKYYGCFRDKLKYLLALYGFNGIMGIITYYEKICNNRHVKKPACPTKAYAGHAGIFLKDRNHASREGGINEKNYIGIMYISGD